MIQFTSFLGVDQTGATNSKGVPKPLPAALIYKTNSSWKLVFSEKGQRLELPSLQRKSLIQLLQRFPNQDLPHTALILDSVFGLPASQFPFARGGSASLFKLFQQAQKFSFKEKEFGRDTAEKFFAQFLRTPAGQPLPQRFCEKMSGANSVFLTRSFQRNIGCGTFRIWKDLGASDKKWFQIWGFDSGVDHGPLKNPGPWVFEAYPSLFWKKVLGFPTRNPRDLIHYLKTKARKNLQVQGNQYFLLLEDPDLCDSVVLALSAKILQEEGEGLWQIPAFPDQDKEGWILGL